MLVWRTSSTKDHMMLPRVHLSPCTKVDEGDVDTSNRWSWALEASTCSQLRIKVKEFEIAKIGIEEGVDLGSWIKEFMLPNLEL